MLSVGELISPLLPSTLGDRRMLGKVTLPFKATGVSFGAFLPQQLLPSESLPSCLLPSLRSPWGLIMFLAGQYEIVQCWLTRRVCYGNFTGRTASVLKEFTSHIAEQGMIVLDDDNRTTLILNDAC